MLKKLLFALSLFSIQSIHAYTADQKSISCEDFFMDTTQLNDLLEKADAAFACGNYEYSRYLYSAICFTLLPNFEDSDKVIPNFTKDELNLFCDALIGRLRSLFLLKRFDTFHHKELELYKRIDTRMPFIFDNKLIFREEVTDEEFEEIIDILEENDLISKDMPITEDEDGFIEITLKRDCCISCENGNECEGYEEPKKKLIEKSFKSSCKLSCGYIRDGLLIFAGAPKGKIASKVICVYVIDELFQKCKKCCKSGRVFYRDCVKPMVKYLGHALKPHVDPSFNDDYDDIYIESLEEFLLNANDREMRNFVNDQSTIINHFDYKPSTQQRIEYYWGEE